MIKWFFKYYSDSDLLVSDLRSIRRSYIEEARIDAGVLQNNNIYILMYV